MLVDRHPPADLCALVPRLMAGFEPELRELDRLLDGDEICRRVKADLARRKGAEAAERRRGGPMPG